MSPYLYFINEQNFVNRGKPAHQDQDYHALTYKYIPKKIIFYCCFSNCIFTLSCIYCSDINSNSVFFTCLFTSLGMSKFVAWIALLVYTASLATFNLTIFSTHCTRQAWPRDWYWLYLLPWLFTIPVPKFIFFSATSSSTCMHSISLSLLLPSLYDIFQKSVVTLNKHISWNLLSFLLR